MSLSSEIVKVLRIFLENRIYRSRVEAKKLRKLQSKLDTLIGKCYEVKTWLAKHEEHCLDNAEKPMEESPMEKIKSIAHSHFPELAQDVRTFSLAEVTYRKHLYDLGLSREEKKKMPHEFKHPTEYLYEWVLRWQDRLVESARALKMKLNDEKSPTGGKFRRFFSKFRRN